MGVLDKCMANRRVSLVNGKCFQSKQVEVAPGTGQIQPIFTGGFPLDF